MDSIPRLAVAAQILLRGGGHEHSLNTRGAFLHVVGDLLGSFGVIAAAIVMLATGWYLADPLLSVGIGRLILHGAWRLFKEAVDVLLEATPAHIAPGEARAALQEIPGVRSVHDLHIGTVTSGLVALSGHLEVTGQGDWHVVLAESAALLRERFGIAHATLQPEGPHVLGETFRGCSPDTPEGRGLPDATSAT